MYNIYIYIHIYIYIFDILMINAWPYELTNMAHRSLELSYPSQGPPPALGRADGGRPSRST